MGLDTKDTKARAVRVCACRLDRKRALVEVAEGGPTIGAGVDGLDTKDAKDAKDTLY
jgi:hypothetical protein